MSSKIPQAHSLKLLMLVCLCLWMAAPSNASIQAFQCHVQHNEDGSLTMALPPMSAEVEVIFATLRIELRPPADSETEHEIVLAFTLRCSGSDEILHSQAEVFFAEAGEDVIECILDLSGLPRPENAACYGSGMILTLSTQGQAEALHTSDGNGHAILQVVY